MPVDEAIILVGGLGTRLRVAVPDLPKPLAPVAGRPFLAWLLDALVEGGIGGIILATGHGAGQVRAAIGDRWRGARVRYSHEDAPLGTGGALKQALGMVSGNGVHVANGDTYLRYSPVELRQSAAAEGIDAAIALAEVDDVGRYGAVDLRDGRVHGFREKGGHGRGLVNAGCYYLGPGALRRFPPTEAFSLEREVLPQLARDGRLAGMDRTEAFIDIGVPEDYARAQAWFGR